MVKSLLIMASAENLFQISKNDGKNELIQINNKSVPLRWFAHPKITPLMNEQASKVIDYAQNTLQHKNLEKATYKVLSQQDGLISTIRFLFNGYEPEINRMNTMAIQMGRKAYIILCQAETTAGKGHFAIYLGRNADSSGFGHEAERDFCNLKDLNEVAEQKLTDKAKKKYKFLKPIVLMEPVEIDGNEYSSFTIPSIDNYGELRADVFENEQARIRFPFFRYSLSFSRTIELFNDLVNKRNLTIQKNFIHLIKRFPDKSQEYILMQLIRTLEFQTIKKQMEDLLIGNALIYLLSNGHFPKEFMVNAGDWMVNFVNDSLYLYLITIRGGWEKLEGDGEWMEK